MNLTNLHFLAAAQTAAPGTGDAHTGTRMVVDFGNFLNATPDHYQVLGWIVLLPLLGALINGLLGKRIGRDGVYIIGVATVGASFLLSLVAFAALVRAAGHEAAAAAAAAASAGGEHAAEHGAHGAVGPATQLSYLAWDWFKAPLGPSVGGQVKVRFVLDALSGVMLLVVTGVGTLIHLYSTGYMSHDKGYARFFAYLNLFMFSMLNLILGDSIVQLFVGWEGVGLCSYLLIGFWFTNSQYASAGRKAFIVNRIGDVGVILGMTILAWKLGAWDFSGMRAAAGGAPMNDPLAGLKAPVELADAMAYGLSFGSTGLHDLIYKIVPNFTWGSLACLLLFIGCAGKSAQIPLYVWLPDAMAGPTPVSALIHAATMVTAGVYLLCRLSFVFVSFPKVMAIIALIGALTALFAATIALVQTELKKVLAYSTVSQLGFMFIGCGVGAFDAGLFHVYTHAMFKACLFLGAGAVMHACRDKQDLRELGGLRKYLPITSLTFGIATLAIIGTPGFSGFFSKDEILFRALASHNPAVPWAGTVAFAMGVAAATLTAFYMCRLYIMTFLGDFKGWSLSPAETGPGPQLKPGDPPLQHEHEPANAPEADNNHNHDDHAAHAHDDHGHDDHGHGHGKPWDPPQENPWNVTTPLIVLAVASVIAGYIGLPHVFTGREGILPRWLAPVVTDWEIDHHALAATEWKSMAFGVTAFVVGSVVAYYFYVAGRGEPARNLAAALPRLYRLLFDKWRVDELYDLIIVRPLRAVSNFAAYVFDRWIIDGLVKLVGLIPRGLGALLRKAQTGTVQVYGAMIAVGVLALLGWAAFRPSASITYRVVDGQRMELHAHGGPGYTYQWDLQGDGHFGDETHETQQMATCATPIELPDGRRVCRVGLRARNAFNSTTETVRTIELPATATEDRR